MKAPRTFGVLDPVLLEIINPEEAPQTEIDVKIFPSDPSKGTQRYTFSKYVYIERADFRLEHDDKFFGLSPKQPVCLRYGPFVEFVGIERQSDGSDHIKVRINQSVGQNKDKKVKGILHWVSKDHSLNAVVRLYQALFKVEDLNKAGDEWLNHINPESLVVKENAKIWNIHKDCKAGHRFQFERVGYFILDKDSNPAENKFIFNRIVELREAKEKPGAETIKRAPKQKKEKK